MKLSWWRSLTPETQAGLIRGAISLIGLGAYVWLVYYVAKKEGRSMNLKDVVQILEYAAPDTDTVRYAGLDNEFTTRLHKAFQSPTAGPVIDLPPDAVTEVFDENPHADIPRELPGPQDVHEL